MVPKRFIPCVLLVGAALLFGTRIVSTQDTGEHGGAAGMSDEFMMETMRLAQPGPEHAELAKLVGEWETDVALRMAPGMPPATQKASATVKTILGGRFLEIESQGDFMGQPFESRAILGYDRRLEQYTIIALDTLGTYWVTGQGTRGDDGVIRMVGEDPEPMGKQVYTFEYEVLGPDAFEHRVVFHQLGDQVFEDGFAMVTVRHNRKAD